MWVAQKLSSDIFKSSDPYLPGLRDYDVINALQSALLQYQFPARTTSCILAVHHLSVRCTVTIMEIFKTSLKYLYPVYVTSFTAVVFKINATFY